MNDKALILKKLIYFFIIVFVLDYALGAALKKGYFSQKSGFDYRTTYAINQNRSDILILGSSRASHHYIPSLIEDSLKLSAYNGGRDACFMFYYYALLQANLKRYHPKVIVLDIIPDEFQQYQDSYDHLNLLLPYCDSHPEIREVCQLRGKQEKFKLLSHIYSYNSKLLPVITAFADIKKKDSGQDDPNLKGYVRMNRVLNEPKAAELLSDQIDTLKVAYFKKFINDCKSAKVKLIVTFSPIYVQYNTPRNKNVEIAKSICELNKIPFFDYLDDKDFDDPKLYADWHHLNNTGAELYTKKYIANIRKALSSSN